MTDTALSGGRLDTAAANRSRPSTLSGQFVCYVGWSGAAALVNFAAGSVLVDVGGMTSPALFPAAVALAYGLGMAVNFAGNRRFTFASQRTGLAQARTFVVVALSGLALTTGIATLLRPMLALQFGPGGLAGWMPSLLASPEAQSRLLAIGLAALYSFAGHKYLTFNRGLRPLLRLLHSRAIRRSC